MTAPALEHDFFLCHAGNDKPRVEAYAKRLGDLGATTAFDKYDILPGQDWIVRILDLLPSSRICVVFVSQHSSTAIVQRNEAFLARYLARDQPDRHQVVPVYLEGAPAQSNIHGLETTSGFREDRESLEEIAQGLVTQLRAMGDPADRTTRTIGMIDEVAWRWLFAPEHSFAARYELKGDQMVLRQREWTSKEFLVVNTIWRDQFDSKLKPDQLRLISHM